MPRELMVLFSLIGLFTVWVVLPLVPSILIYRLFPNTSVAVSGPLANLTVRASGAFAAYMVVFLVTFPLVQTTKETIGGFQRPFWTISGTVKLVGMDGKEIRSQSLLNKIRVETKPDPHIIHSAKVKLRVMEEQEQDFPLIIVKIGDFGEHTIDLKKSHSEFAVDKYLKTIEMRQPIIIHEERRGGGGAVLSEALASQPDDRLRVEEPRSSFR